MRKAKARKRRERKTRQAKAHWKANPALRLEALKRAAQWLMFESEKLWMESLGYKG